MKTHLRCKGPRRAPEIARTQLPSTQSPWPSNGPSASRKWLCETDRERNLRTKSARQTGFQSRRHGQTTTSPIFWWLPSILGKVQATHWLNWNLIHSLRPSFLLVTWFGRLIIIIPKISFVEFGAVLLFTEIWSSGSYMRVQALEIFFSKSPVEKLPSTVQHCSLWSIIKSLLKDGACNYLQSIIDMIILAWAA